MAEGVDTSDYQRMATALRRAGDKELWAATRRTLSAAAQPAGLEAIREGSGAMPSRGGLRARLESGGRVTVRMRLDGAVAALQTKDGVQLGALDGGDLRHPVFAGVSMSRKAAEMQVTEAVAESGGKLKYGMRRAVSRLRNAGRKWVSQDVPKGTYRQAMEARLPEIRPKVEAAVEDVLKGIR